MKTVAFLYMNHKLILPQYILSASPSNSLVWLFNFRATDWVPVLNTMRINKTLNFVAVRSYYQQTLEEQGKLVNFL